MTSVTITNVYIQLEGDVIQCRLNVPFIPHEHDPVMSRFNHAQLITMNKQTRTSEGRQPKCFRLWNRFREMTGTVLQLSIAVSGTANLNTGEVTINQPKFSIFNTSTRTMTHDHTLYQRIIKDIGLFAVVGFDLEAN